MKSSRPIYLLIILALLIRNAHAKDDWLQVQSANFHLVSNAGEREVKQTVFKLEQFRYLFSQLFPKERLNALTPTEVIAFKNAKTFRPFLPIYQGKAKSLSGYFQRGRDKNFIAINLDALAENPYQVIFHEYIHLLLSQNLQTYPLWFQEGLAEFYSNCDIAGKEVALGKHYEQHIFTLRESKLIPLDQLFQVNHKSPIYNESRKEGIFYAQSWLFIHYFMLGKHPEGQKQLGRFIDLLAAGKDYTEAFKQTLSADFKTIEKELQNYIGSRSLRFYKFKLKSIDIDKDFAVTRLQPAEVAYYMGDLLLHLDRFAEAKAYLQQALDADRNFAPAYESMGIGYLYQGNFAEAKRYLQAAVERTSQNFLAHYYYARTLMQEMTAQGGVVTAIPDAPARAMMDSLQKAIRLAPNFADAYELLAFVYVVQDIRIDEGIEFMRKAMALSPSRHEFGLTLAQLYIRKQDFPQAKMILAKTIKITSDEDLRAQCRQRLEMINQITDH